MERDRAARTALAVAALGVLPSVWTAWILWFAPVEGLTADRTALAARDFTALWAAGRAAAEQVLSTLSDPVRFTAYLRGLFGDGIPDQIWPYPPPILLLARPLADLPLAVAFALYSGLGIVALAAVLRLAGLAAIARLAVLVSPAVATNALAGQNGSIVAALLVGGLALLERSPGLAGLLLGGLVIKPQFALLIPVCLLAGRRWRALAASCASAATLASLSSFAFGYKPWVEFATDTQRAVSAYIGAPWQLDPAHSIFSSSFMAARSLGASLAASSMTQAAVTAACILVAWLTWRSAALSPSQRMAATLPLVLLAAPWVHTYDMPALAVSAVILAGRETGSRRMLLAFAWLWPGLSQMIFVPPTLAVLSIASVAWLAASRPQPACAASPSG